MTTINMPVKKTSRSRWLIVILILLAVVVALGVWLTWPTASDEPASEAGQPQALWQAQDIGSYRYTLTLSCFCPQELVQPVTIEVINGEPASLTYAATGQLADAALFEPYTSIDKLHAIIAEAETQNPARRDITYDPATGVPLNVDIDISELMADEEIRFTVTGFEQLP